MLRGEECQAKQGADPASLTELAEGYDKGLRRHDLVRRLRSRGEVIARRNSRAEACRRVGLKATVSAVSTRSKITNPRSARIARLLERKLTTLTESAWLRTCSLVYLFARRTFIGALYAAIAGA